MFVRIVLISVLLLSFNMQGQDYAKVDAIVRNYPNKINTTLDLATKINSDFNLDEEKVRAAYQWLSNNIDYEKVNDVFDIADYQIIYASEKERLRQLETKNRKKIKRILKTNKAICIGYARVFKAICDDLNIQSEIVVGYSKTMANQINNDATYKNHAWNAVKINNIWQLLDITWSTVSQVKEYKHYNDYYFFVDPKELILTHFPVNRDWQLLESPISKATFFKTPIFYANYFIEQFKIADNQGGIIEISDKKAQVYFDKIPNSKKVFYTLDGQNYKPMMYKKTKDGNYVGSFKYKNNKSKNITIYSESLPILSFAIDAKIE